MKLTYRKTHGVAVVEIHGKLVGGAENADEFRGLFRSLIAQGERSFVVNLKYTAWANSQGIGMLIGAYTSVRNAGGEFVLAHVTSRSRDILTMTKLLLIFKDFDLEREAVAYLAGIAASAGTTTETPTTPADETGTTSATGPTAGVAAAATATGAGQRG